MNYDLSLPCEYSTPEDPITTLHLGLDRKSALSLLQDRDHEIRGYAFDAERNRSHYLQEIKRTIILSTAFTLVAFGGKIVHSIYENSPEPAHQQVARISQGLERAGFIGAGALGVIGIAFGASAVGAHRRAQHHRENSQHVKLIRANIRHERESGISKASPKKRRDNDLREPVQAL